MTKENFAQATAYLKQAVPLMIKYQIPTTPTQYALWYTYVAQTNPELNQAIETELQQSGSCSPLASEMLYEQHLASQTERDVEGMKQSLEALATELSTSMQDTLSGTGLFQNMLDNSFGRLAKMDEEGLSIEETIALVRELIVGSKEIRQSTQAFHNQLSTAEKEIADLKTKLEKTREEANHDALTGMLNRRAFDQELQHRLDTHQPFSLVMLDIDRFKNLNDEFGHLFGDQVLRAIARRVRSNCKEGEKAFRIGGEEMAILLPGRSLLLARQFAESLRRGIERISVLDRTSQRRLNNITASFGVAEYQTGDDYDTLLGRADEQLYRAKSLGRNRVMPMSL